MEQYSISIGILAMMLDVRVWHWYGPVAEDSDAVSMLLFRKSVRRKMWDSVERCAGYLPVMTTDVAELAKSTSKESTVEVASSMRSPPRSANESLTAVKHCTRHTVRL